MSTMLTVHFEYKVSVPDEGTKEYDDIFAEMKSEDPSYYLDKENSEPQVVQGDMAFFMIEGFHIGNYTDSVEMVDGTVVD